MRTSRQFSVRQILLFVVLSAAALACFRTRVVFSHDDGYKYYAFHLLFGAFVGGAGGALLGKAWFYALAGLIAGTVLAVYDVMNFAP